MSCSAPKEQLNLLWGLMLKAWNSLRGYCPKPRNTMIFHLVTGPLKLQKGREALKGSEAWRSCLNQTAAREDTEVPQLLGNRMPHGQCDFSLTYFICPECENLLRAEMSLFIEGIRESPWSLQLVWLHSIPGFDSKVRRCSVGLSLLVTSENYYYSCHGK